MNRLLPCYFKWLGKTFSYSKSILTSEFIPAGAIQTDLSIDNRGNVWLAFGTVPDVIGPDENPTRTINVVVMDDQENIVGKNLLNLSNQYPQPRVRFHMNLILDCLTQIVKKNDIILIFVNIIFVNHLIFSYFSIHSWIMWMQWPLNPYTT
jgi:hypothetical protein